MILISKGYRMNRYKIGSFYRGFKDKEESICLVDNVNKFDSKYRDWTKQELKKQGRWNESKWVYSPIGNLAKKMICVTYNARILNENNVKILEIRFKNILKFISKTMGRKIVFAFILKSKYVFYPEKDRVAELNNKEYQWMMVFCLSKFHDNEKEIVLDDLKDNFEKSFLDDLNKGMN